MNQARRVVGFAFVTVFLDLMGFGIIIPLFPFYVKSMGGSAETVGVILSCFSLTQLVATPILGRLSDRVGRRPVILLSLLGNAASMVLFALATKLTLLPLLFVSRIIAGATAGNIAACQAAIADVTSVDDRAKGMGRLGAGIGLGMVLGPVLGSWVSQVGPWAPPLAAAALAIADVVGAFFFMPETKPATKTGRSAPGDAARPARSSGVLRELLGDRAIAIVFALFFFTFLSISTINVTLPLLTNERLGWTEREIGHVFGIFGLVMLVIQGGLIGKLTRRFGAPRLVIVGALSSAVGLTAVALAHETVPLVAGLAGLAIGFGLLTPCLSTLASEHAGEERQGTVLGFAQSSGGLARTVGPTLTGVAYAHIAPAAPFFGGAAAALLSVVLGLALLGHPKRSA